MLRVLTGFYKALGTGRHLEYPLLHTQSKHNSSHSQYLCLWGILHIGLVHVGLAALLQLHKPALTEPTSMWQVEADCGLQDHSTAQHLELLAASLAILGGMGRGGSSP